MPYAEVKGTLTDIGSEVSVLTKNASQPAYLLDSQRCRNSGYIEVSKWRFLFKGKKDKRSCEFSPVDVNKKASEQDEGELQVRVLLGLAR